MQGRPTTERRRNESTDLAQIITLFEQAERLLEQAQRLEETARKHEETARKELSDIQAIKVPKRASAPLKTRILRWLARRSGLQLGVLWQYGPTKFKLPKDCAQPVELPKDPPTISVVTPSFRQGRFIEATIKSVLDQNYPKLEYVVQDGGSNDETVDVLKQYDNQLLHWESAPDRGQTHAINLGFRHTSGEIMAYLNSDDLLLPGSLAYVAKYFAEHPEVDVVYGNRILIDAEGSEIGRWVMPPHDDNILKWVDYVPQETMFWRRRVWQQLGGAFDESFQFAMDWDWLIRMQDAGCKFARLPRYLGAFRVHNSQKTQEAQETTGAREMARLRQRCHGRHVTQPEIRTHMRGFLIRHIVHRWLHAFGLYRG